MPDLIFYTHPMSRGRIVRWMLEFDMWPKREPFVSYAERAMARPAHQRASALDDALIGGKA